jgi:hypothetical protein
MLNHRLALEHFSSKAMNQPSQLRTTAAHWARVSPRARSHAASLAVDFTSMDRLEGLHFGRPEKNRARTPGRGEGP